MKWLARLMKRAPEGTPSGPHTVGLGPGISVAASNEAVARQSEVAAFLTVPPPVPISPASLGSRPELARDVLDSEDLPDVATGEDVHGNAEVGVWFSDLLAHEFSDLVEETVVVAEGVVGVDRAFREDREFIAVYGRTIDPAQLEATVRTWWVERLRGIAEQGGAPSAS